MGRGGKTLGPAPSAQIMSWLGLLLLAAALPLYRELPGPIALYLSALFALHLALLRFSPRHGGRWLPLLLGIAAVWLVLRQFHTLFGYQAGISLFALLLVVKAMESRSERDLYVTFVLGLFFLGCQFLVEQSMYLALYSLLVVVGMLALLQQHNRRRPAPLGQALRFGLATLFQALPLAVVLFLLFPRLDGPLWSLDLQETRGVTGLSDSMTPGSINGLIRSKAPVFRADFHGPMPERAQLYWRGPVLWHSDGRRWSLGTPAGGSSPQLKALTSPVRYRLILEPSGKPWILPLDLPATTPGNIPRGVRMTADFQLIAERPIAQRRHFLLESLTRYHTGPLGQAERRAALQLPENVTPRMNALAARWRATAGDGGAVVQIALEHFNREPFIYTLSPPLAGANPDDGFLFETRAGFCEHYASAFTLLMRLAGIPSRVVTGYLGGEHNQLGNYLMVRQSDAHAWSEVWLDGRGWVRIDPTAAVAPERVMQEIGLFDDSPGSPVSFRLSAGGPLNASLRQLRMALDALNTRWHIWVLGYDSRRQAQLLDWLGLDLLKPLGIALAMAAALGLIMAALGYGLLRRRGDRPDPARRLYDLFCRRLAAAGVRRAPHEGPEDFARRAVRARSDLAPAIRRITALYCRLRYSGQGTTEQLQELGGLVRGFRPKRKSKRRQP